MIEFSWQFVYSRIRICMDLKPHHSPNLPLSFRRLLIVDHSPLFASLHFMTPRFLPTVEEEKRQCMRLNKKQVRFVSVKAECPNHPSRSHARQGGQPARGGGLVLHDDRHDSIRLPASDQAENYWFRRGAECPGFVVCRSVLPIFMAQISVLSKQINRDCELINL